MNPRRSASIPALLCTAALLLSAAPARASDFQPDAALARLDQSLDWRPYALLAVQDAGRYKTLESFARETLTAMTGAPALPGLSPCASALEWAFNPDAYADTRIVYLKDAVMRREIAFDLPPERQEQAIATGWFTPRELTLPAVTRRLGELQAITRMQSAVSRVLEARQMALEYPYMFRPIPPAGGAYEDAWYCPRDTLWSLPPEVLTDLGLRLQDLQQVTSVRRKLPGVTADDALAFARLAAAWRDRDVAQVRANLDLLVARLPAIAGAGYYPPAPHRRAELIYYRMNKFTSGWIVYLFGALAAVFAVVTRWRTPTAIAAILVIAGLLWHAAGVVLRWYILDRIPVGNMFEAMFAASWMCVAGALVIALYFRHPVFLLAAAATGFFALILSDVVMPAHQSNLGTIMAILDDVMLRIHTTLIVLSYALVFLGSVIAVIYLFGYYQVRSPLASIEAGLAAALSGLVLWLFAGGFFSIPDPSTISATALVKLPGAALVAGLLAALLLAAIPLLRLLRAPSIVHANLVTLSAACIAIAVGSHAFVTGLGLTMLIGGLGWSAATAGAVALRRFVLAAAAPLQPALALGSAGAAPTVVALPTGLFQRPLLAGGMPGDDHSDSRLPRWLNELDWCHLIVLNIIFVTLFVGTILGAVWADYSWGRPWGWDPKEVFALNTWIVYAILIHIRFIVKARGVWTAWLSLVGCAVMAFNWYVVNMHIVGLHSYA